MLNKAKADAKFTEIKTGNTELDKLLDKAISLGKKSTNQCFQLKFKFSTSQASSSSATKAMQAVRPFSKHHGTS